MSVFAREEPMIAEITPDWYDTEGRKVFRPDSRRKSGFKPTFPAGRFLSQPLKYWCSDLTDMRRFLAGCKYVSDEEQFGERDYWQPPERFEESKKGDCEDFALWAWRQLIHMKYPARFALGSASRYGDGHAWITFQKDGKTYLLEPLSWPVGLTLPRLSVLRYKPKFSMSWDGAKVSYFEHTDRKKKWTPTAIATLGWEWLIFWVFFFLRTVSVATRRRAKAIG
jgi:Bacterial transglutaminase-like cysteine proteinase BTLCP